ncbi:MAG: PP2C family protein-serine/threonine phosphatase [Planctomycetia bacterium]|nr:PP2C family protein-serine/threonine phosphatase [Planctomycetia bacterium]
MADVASRTDMTTNERLRLIIDMMREMSKQTDPQVMVRAYGARVRQLLSVDRFVSLSRRGLVAPHYRITRSDFWKEDINPWKEPHRLPAFDRGLFGELLYAEEPKIIAPLAVPDDDPAAEYLAGMKSLMAVPHFDRGAALNMVISASRAADAFDPERLPELVWLSTLFGRATHNLVLNEQLQAAYAAVDHELAIVADIQRSLLPVAVPHIPTLDLAIHYQTSRRAGGDYYDFFPLPSGQWGILLADVSGHGTPAAVMMAITHSIAHAYPGPPTPPCEMLSFVNRRLASLYTPQFDTFITAFYGIYDPATRTLRYACAGHNPPRLKRPDGSILALDGVRNLPLGIAMDEVYEEAIQTLAPGDVMVLYTDGVTEAHNMAGDLFGLDGLDRVLRATNGRAAGVRDALLEQVEGFAAGQPADDDRTLLVAGVA